MRKIIKVLMTYILFAIYIDTKSSVVQALLKHTKVRVKVGVKQLCLFSAS